MQTEAFQGCQAHNSFVCHAIETSCSLLSQYLLPNGMCALLLPLLNNTRLERGTYYLPSLSFTLHPPPRHPMSLSVLPSLFFILTHPIASYFLYSSLQSQSFYSPFPLILPSPIPSIHYHISSICTSPRVAKKHSSGNSIYGSALTALRNLRQIKEPLKAFSVVI